MSVQYAPLLDSAIVPVGSGGGGGGVSSLNTLTGAVTLAAGTNVSLTPSGNTLTIASSAGGLPWTNVTGGSQLMSPNNGYIANNASQVVFGLPNTAAIGTVLAVVGAGAGGWEISQSAGQTIHLESTSTTTGTGGSLVSTNRYDSLELLCTTANTDWVVRTVVGNITLV